jgi:hypothetical protein
MQLKEGLTLSCFPTNSKKVQTIERAEKVVTNRLTSLKCGNGTDLFSDQYLINSMESSAIDLASFALANGNNCDYQQLIYHLINKSISSST